MGNRSVSYWIRITWNSYWYVLSSQSKNIPLYTVYPCHTSAAIYRLHASQILSWLQSLLLWLTELLAQNTNKSNVILVNYVKWKKLQLTKLQYCRRQLCTSKLNKSEQTATEYISQVLFQNYQLARYPVCASECLHFWFFCTQKRKFIIKSHYSIKAKVYAADYNLENRQNQNSRAQTSSVTLHHEVHKDVETVAKWTDA